MTDEEQKARRELRQLAAQSLQVPGLGSARNTFGKSMQDLQFELSADDRRRLEERRQEVKAYLQIE